jgi:hypothetical protein
MSVSREAGTRELLLKQVVACTLPGISIICVIEICVTFTHTGFKICTVYFFGTNITTIKIKMLYLQTLFVMFFVRNKSGFKAICND